MSTIQKVVNDTALLFQTDFRVGERQSIAKIELNYVDGESFTTRFTGCDGEDKLESLDLLGNSEVSFEGDSNCELGQVTLQTDLNPPKDQGLPNHADVAYKVSFLVN